MGCRRFEVGLEGRISQKRWQWQQLEVRFGMREEDRVRQDLESGARNERLSIWLRSL